MYNVFQTCCIETVGHSLPVGLLTGQMCSCLVLPFPVAAYVRCCRVLAAQVLPLDLSARHLLCHAKLCHVRLWPVCQGFGWNLAAIPDHHFVGLHLRRK